MSQPKAPVNFVEHEAPYAHAEAHKPHPWWQVLCLTGVDYFSTLGYQPGIAALAAGALAPFATFILVLLTLFGAVPVYSRVASESPHGEGSVAMLERLLMGWKGKLFVLVLLGFAATDFIITITLSAADATAHIIENPFAPHWAHHHRIAITLVLIGLLGAVFFKGFKEAIGIAVGLVGIYLTLNVIVIGAALVNVVHHPEFFPRWLGAVRSPQTFLDLHSPKMFVDRAGTLAATLGMSLIIFPQLALGLSGFETGVAVMPLVKSEDGSVEKRIANTKRLLLCAALIMSLFLMASSFATTLAIAPDEFKRGGEANGRALAYLAHKTFGDGFGTVYDVSTILILWFAGASAMAALLNLVPRYLPRYGMAPEWARASRPLAVVFTLISFAVTIAFRADVDAQGGAYATGVLVLITSAATAAMLSAHKKKQNRLWPFFACVALVFLYTTVQNIHERPEGIKIAGIFILSIIVISFLSRVYRTTELRAEHFDIDPLARQFIMEAGRDKIRIIANEPNERDEEEYRLKEKEQREDNHIPADEPVIFLEVTIGDASDFTGTLKVEGEERFGYRILKMKASSIPNSIAALLLRIRDMTGTLPHAYFSWTEGNPFIYLLKYIAFGEGDIAPMTREVLREAESNPEKRPGIHLGG